MWFIYYPIADSDFIYRYFCIIKDMTYRSMKILVVLWAVEVLFPTISVSEKRFEWLDTGIWQDEVFTVGILNSWHKGSSMGGVSDSWHNGWFGEVLTIFVTEDSPVSTERVSVNSYSFLSFSSSLQKRRQKFNSIQIVFISHDKGLLRIILHHNSFSELSELSIVLFNVIKIYLYDDRKYALFKMDRSYDC